jgi:DNA helicase HerA-like ATPase
MGNVIEQKVGVFKGFSESALEFKAEIVTPYHTEFPPTLGGFLLVESSAEDYLLGRITKFYPVGAMAGDEADDYLARLIRTNRRVPEDIKEAKLRYNVNVKLLGGIHVGSSSKLDYRPSIRVLPHLGALVGVPSIEVIRYLCGKGVSASEDSVSIGHFALGDAVFSGDNGTEACEISFNLDRLIGRRTYVFAHAGYGKTNLIKFLLTKLYAKTQSAGLLIFDPEGEYAFTDRENRPGLADIPDLAQKVVVYTDRQVIEDYAEFKGGELRFDLSEFSPATVVANCVVPEKLENVWANAVRGLLDHEWAELVDELYRNNYRSDPNTITRLVQNPDKSIPQSILNNLVPVVRKLHRPNSRLMEGILWHLQKGNVVVLDISLLSATHGRWVASLILGRIFQENQGNFVVGPKGELLNVIAVIEEAQAVLSKRPNEPDNIFVSWAKEGRKYNLGAIFVTQQPGAISHELLSQGDNFFVFHLLSAQDLFALKNANAHFSDDILASLLNEPIPGNAYFWSAPYQPFVLPMRVTNFQTYAEGQKQGGPRAETAARRFASQITNLQEELDNTIRSCLESNSHVATYAKLEINGRASPQFAVKLWNLKFAACDSLSSEATRIYSETMSDGKRIVPENVIYESLDRQKVPHMLGYAESTPYLVFPNNVLSVEKSLKQELLSLRSNEKLNPEQSSESSQQKL